MLIHIAIVSDQVLANLIPALMERPEKVYLVCSEKMAEKGLDKRIKRLLVQQGVDTIIRAGATDTGLREIQEYAFDLAAEVRQQYPGAEIVFNATGGNKLMVLGFFEMFRGIAQRIIYTDTQHHCIEVVHHHAREKPDPVPMADVLDVPSYLAAQGFHFQGDLSGDGVWLARSMARKQVCKYLARNASQLGDFIGALNGLVGKALDNKGETLQWPRQNFREIPRGRWAQALQEIAGAGLLRWEGGVEVDIPDLETARFLQGGWLEEYAWHIVRDEHLFDTRINTRGVWEGAQQARNEFDVLACHHNQLLFIECKTLKYDPGMNDNDIAYKVESLGKDARGLFGSTWLLSAREPSDVLRDRARQARFDLLGPGDLPHLRERVQSWMKG